MSALRRYRGEFEAYIAQADGRIRIPVEAAGHG
jgi:hypothetical protein